MGMGYAAIDPGSDQSDFGHPHYSPTKSPEISMQYFFPWFLWKRCERYHDQGKTMPDI